MCCGYRGVCPDCAPPICSKCRRPNEDGSSMTGRDALCDECVRELSPAERHWLCLDVYLGSLERFKFAVGPEDRASFYAEAKSLGHEIESHMEAACRESARDATGPLLRTIRMLVEVLEMSREDLTPDEFDAMKGEALHRGRYFLERLERPARSAPLHDGVPTPEQEGVPS